MAQQQQEYFIKKAAINADRLGEEYDIRAYIFSASFFEDLEKPYVTGQLMFMDDIGLIQDIQLKGTETITMQIESQDPSLKADWEMTFNIVSIIEATRTSERVEAYHINLISPHAFRDQNIKISRSYTGRVTEISEAILKNHLECDLDRSYSGGEQEAQEPVRIITPYLSPLESVVWLIDRATTEIGAPYYIYQTLYDQQPSGGKGEDPKDKLRLGNLETMMKQEGFNTELHAQHTISGANQVALKTLEEQKTTVKAYTVANVEDTLKLSQEGALGANLIQLDTFTSQRFVRHLNTSDLLDRLASRDIITGGRELQNVFDEEQKITVGGEKKTLGECDSRFLTSINSFGTYGTVNSYADVQDQSQAMNKIRSSAVRSLLNRNMIDVTITGALTFAPKAAGGESLLTIGDVIWIDFIESDVDKKTPKKNAELSGKYLIHKARNIYRDTIHETIISVSKLARDETSDSSESD